MESLLINRLSTLSHPSRMAVFRLLMRRCPDELPAGEIAEVLGLKASTASPYLSALTRADLISQRRDGTRLLYSANLNAAREVIADLFFDCCRGRADLCPPEFSNLLADVAPRSDRSFNILFLCTGNSARSIFAESILRDMAGKTFNVYSAGTAQRSEPNPFAVALLRSKGHDVSALRSKNMSEFRGPGAPMMDFVVTVCDHAANEDCPTWPGQPVSGHWGVPDPVAAGGTDAEKRHAFHQAYNALHSHIKAFLSLPFEELDRGELQRRVDEIGRDTVAQDQ